MSPTQLNGDDTFTCDFQAPVLCNSLWQMMNGYGRAALWRAGEPG
jgi:hypothetical protein